MYIREDKEFYKKFKANYNDCKFYTLISDYDYEGGVIKRGSLLKLEKDTPDDYLYEERRIIFSASEFDDSAKYSMLVNIDDFDKLFEPCKKADDLYNKMVQDKEKSKRKADNYKMVLQFSEMLFICLTVIWFILQQAFTIGDKIYMGVVLLLCFVGLIFSKYQKTKNTRLNVDAVQDYNQQIGNLATFLINQN